ncbi:MAG: 5'-nucleotidase [Chitinophagaceae bacterium]
MKLVFHYIILFTLISLIACHSPMQINGYEPIVYSVNTQSLDTLNAIEQSLVPYRAQLSATMNQVIANAEGDFKKEKPNSTLGNLVAKAVYDFAKTKDTTIYAAIINYGGIRLPEIKKGIITRGKIFELLPFDNEIVIVPVKGTDLKTWMQQIANSGGWPVWSSEFISIQQETLGKTIKDENTYQIATIDYVANGGDDCDFLKKYPKQYYQALLRDIVINTLEVQKNIFPNNRKTLE